MMIPNELPPSVLAALEAGVPAVRAFREATGESTVGFADVAGLDPDRLSAIEAGQTPTSSEVAAIASALGVSVDDLNAALE